MNTALKFVVATFLALQFTAINFQTATAQAADTAAADTLCDYCKDYTDAGASAGNIKSAYRPVTGYATESKDTASQEQKLDVAKLRPQPNSAMPSKASN
jgi:hypothetical protein